MEAVEASVAASNGGTLAARVFYPRTLGVPRTAPDLPRAVAAACNGACALVVHQYSVMGGSQDLMRGIAREFATRHGVVAVTFNLRGVGGSSGRCTLTGHGEADDVADVGRWLEAAGFARILLVCSSAGAPIGGSALDRVPAFTACVLRVRAARALAWACGVCFAVRRWRTRRAQSGTECAALTHSAMVVWGRTHARTHIHTRRSYVALGYVFGFWASILFGGHYTAVLESTKPKLFVQARTGNRHFCGCVRSSRSCACRRAALRGCRAARAPRMSSRIPARSSRRVRVRVRQRRLHCARRLVAASHHPLARSLSRSLYPAQWAVPKSKSAVTETRIIDGLGHFQARAFSHGTSRVLATHQAQR
jgi:pimeloyl-ACP methyl ester carboxylesterase